MKYFKKIYENIIYSEFGNMFFLVSILTSLILFAYLLEDKIIYFIKYLELDKLNFVFEFVLIAMSILIINISLRAVKTSYRSRVMVYAFFIAIGVSIRFISFANSYWISDYLLEPFLKNILYLSDFFVAIGFLLGAFIATDKRIKRRTKKVLFLKITIFAILISSIYVAINISDWVMLFKLSKVNLKVFKLLEYISSFFLIATLIIQLKRYAKNKNKYLLSLLSGLVIVLTAQLIKVIFIDYIYIYSYISDLYLIGGYIMIYNAIFGYNIISPIESLRNDEKQIKLYAENLEVVVDRRTTEMKTNTRQLIQEIEYAKSIQQSLLPPRRLNFDEVVFVSEYYPCERLSGDFFDIYRLDENNIGMYILDVSGHGVSAALMTMFCNNYIRSSEKLIMKYRGLKPHRNLKHFYEEFNNTNFPDEMYMVMFFASYNTKSKILTYSSGGINCYPLLTRKSGEQEYLDKSEGFPICRMSSFFTPSFTSETVELSEGDRIVFYTDGLIDDKKNNTITEEQLKEAMFVHRNLSIKSLNKKIKSYIDIEDGVNEDDITYFIMEV